MTKITLTIKVLPVYSLFHLHFSCAPPTPTAHHRYDVLTMVTHRQRQPHTTEMTFNHGYNACLSLIGL
ncbi:hypothetical protein T4B_3607 [Trichinella pseudospiralis]|uniref:Uncharacterized protein n=1 Tax=Trichinella pseudospiralis TaxID=6337 RepID=A0A0V1GMT9_TRIPS|nr:hypothetical protein T4B_3607 [Trichinella pseudospiralis]